LALFLATLLACGVAPADPVQTVSTSNSSLPEANFVCSAPQGEAPLSVVFINLYNGETVSRLWDFGDGQTALEDRPTHVYNSPGKYTVSLTIVGPGGKSRETKTDYIDVTKKAAPAPVSISPSPTPPTLSVGPPSITPGSIDWRDAGKYIGKTETVEGMVVDAYFAAGSNGKPTFLNFNKPYQGYFTCLIWGTERDKFVAAFPPSPEVYFLNKRVRVTGLIKEYAGAPEMILTDVSQIKVIGN
jgi:PKD repeat protein